MPQSSGMRGVVRPRAPPNAPPKPPPPASSASAATGSPLSTDSPRAAPSERRSLVIKQAPSKPTSSLPGVGSKRAPAGSSLTKTASHPASPSHGVMSTPTVSPEDGAMSSVGIVTLDGIPHESLKDAQLAAVGQALQLDLADALEHNSSLINTLSVTAPEDSPTRLTYALSIDTTSTTPKPAADHLFTKISSLVIDRHLPIANVRMVLSTIKQPSPGFPGFRPVVLWEHTYFSPMEPTTSLLRPGHLKSGHPTPLSYPRSPMATPSEFRLKSGSERGGWSRTSSPKVVAPSRPAYKLAASQAADAPSTPRTPAGTPEVRDEPPRKRSSDVPVGGSPAVPEFPTAAKTHGHPTSPGGKRSTANSGPPGPPSASVRVQKHVDDTGRQVRGTVVRSDTVNRVYQVLWDSSDGEQAGAGSNRPFSKGRKKPRIEAARWEDVTEVVAASSAGVHASGRREGSPHRPMRVMRHGGGGAEGHGTVVKVDAQSRLYWVAWDGGAAGAEPEVVRCEEVIEVAEGFEVAPPAANPNLPGLPAKPATPTPQGFLGIGEIVVRNERDWMWGDQDGGAGNTGVVVDVNPAEQWAAVFWKASGETNRYRYGPIAGGWDIDRVAAHPVPTQPASAPPTVRTIVHSRVRRNPCSWLATYEDLDLPGGGLGTATQALDPQLNPLPATVDPSRVSHGYYVEVQWDGAAPSSPPQRYRYGVDGSFDLLVVEPGGATEWSSPQKDARVGGAPAHAQPWVVGPQSAYAHPAVRCVQVTLLSCRGAPPGVSSRVQLSLNGLPAEYTSPWPGDHPSWGETLVLDVPPGISCNLRGKLLRVVHLVQKPGSDRTSPLGGCELELSHLVGPQAQTLWLAMDPSMRSTLVASPAAAGRSLQTTSPAGASSWLRLSIAFVFSDVLQQSADDAAAPPSPARTPACSNQQHRPRQPPPADAPSPPLPAHGLVSAEGSASLVRSDAAPRITLADFGANGQSGLLAVSHNQPPDGCNQRVCGEVSSEEPLFRVVSGRVESWLERDEARVGWKRAERRYHHPEPTTVTVTQKLRTLVAPLQRPADAGSNHPSAPRFAVQWPPPGGTNAPPRSAAEVDLRKLSPTRPQKQQQQQQPPPPPQWCNPGGMAGPSVFGPSKGPYPTPAALPLPARYPAPREIPGGFPQGAHAQRNPSTPRAPPPHTTAAGARSTAMYPLGDDWPRETAAQVAPPVFEANASLNAPGAEPPLPAEGDYTTVVEYLTQLAFDPITVLELAHVFRREQVADVGTLRLLSDADLQDIGIPLGCRRKIAAAVRRIPY
ncbi:hypothetical protein DIPPA_07088 [Diplonema papillatum]|nr:hypothetical protein DIPPA_07088 [Diplonema papillatum]